MPVLIGEKREGGVRVSQGKGGILSYEQDYHYLVQAEHPGVNRFSVVTTLGLPVVNQTTIGGLIMCVSKTAKRNPKRTTLWDVTCTFSSEVQEGTDPSTPQQGDPTAWQPVAEVEFEPDEEVVRKDVDGKAWVNSANKPFETGLIIPSLVASCSFTQFEPAGGLSLDAIMERNAKVNSVTYGPFAKNTLLLYVQKATVGFFYGSRCWKIQYNIKYKNKPALPGKPDTGGWTLHQLDAGYQYYDGTDLKPFLDDGDNPTPYVGLLNGEGGKVADQKTGEPVFLAFKKYGKIDFNAFLRV